MSASQILGEIEKLEKELLVNTCSITCEKIRLEIEKLENNK